MLSDNSVIHIEKYPKGAYKVSLHDGGNFIRYSITNLNTNESYVCFSFCDLFINIENDMTNRRYPENSTEFRTWGLGKQTKRRAFNTISDPDNKEKDEQPSEYATFIIKVICRQHATWQGTIFWIEGKQYRNFRSVNELICLIDEVAAISEPYSSGLCSSVN